MDRYESTARKQAARAVKEHNAATKRLYEVEARLRDLGPFVRDSFFRDLIRTPKEAAHWVWKCLRVADVPIGNPSDGTESFFRTLLVNLPKYATHGHVANLIIEYAHRRGWKKRLEKLLSEDCREALLATKTAALAEYNEKTRLDVESDEAPAQTEDIETFETYAAESEAVDHA